MRAQALFFIFNGVIIYTYEIFKQECIFKMKLTQEEVNAIALESRLVLSENELSGTVKYINNFLDMLDRFKELDLKDVEPFSFAEALECPLREDSIKEFKNTREILNESAHVEDGYFKVPRIMEG